jgi:REP element-mobilizing transposase RayT
MPQSLANVNVHLVYSTKQRERLIEDAIRPLLHAYMGGILRKYDCLPVEINTEPDHAHLLFVLGRGVAISKLVGNLKTGATDWLRKHDPALTGFHWQSGYGAFSVSASNVAAVRNYIRNQREHHRARSFQDEYRVLLRKHGIEWEERYVWD